MSAQTLIIQHPASGGADCEHPGKPHVVVEMLTGDTAGIKAEIPITPILMEHCKDMFLCRFTLPRGAQYRLFLDAKIDRDSAAVATATVTPIPSSVGDLASRLKHLHPLSIIRYLNQCPDTPGDTRVQLAFADYLAACGSQQRGKCDQRTDNISDVSMGGDSASGEQAFIDACDVIAESLRVPVQLSADLNPRHCDVTASSRDSLLMTSLDHDVIYVIRSDESANGEPAITDHVNSDATQLKQCNTLAKDLDQPFLQENGFDMEKFLRAISELLPWLEEWLDKQQEAGRHDDGCDAGSPAAAAGGEDKPTPYAPLSSADDAGSIQLRPLDNDAASPLPQVSECCDSAELDAPDTVAKTTSWEISRDFTDKKRFARPWCPDEQEVDAVAVEMEPDTADMVDNQTWSPGRHGVDAVSISVEKDSADSVDLKELAAAWYPAEDEEDVMNMNSLVVETEASASDIGPAADKDSHSVELLTEPSSDPTPKLEDGGSSTPPKFNDNAAKFEDLDRIELILDPIELNKSGASGDAVQSQSLRRGIEERAGLWQRIRRQWRDFRYRVARRISKMFTRRRYRAPAAD